MADRWRERNVWYQGRSRQRMQMYVHYYERELINEGDNPLIGIVLCADKSESVVKYTLPENETQIFASKCKLYLPSEEELLRELNQELEITPDQLLTGKGIDPEYKDADMDYEVTKADIRILKQIHSLGDEQYKRLMAYMKALQKLEQMERIVED